MTKTDPPLNLTGEGLVTRMVIVLLGAVLQAGMHEGTACAQESLQPGPSARVIGTFGIRFPGSGNPGRFLTMGPVAYFANADSAYGSELWRSDGTESGTFLLKDLAPGRQSSGIRFLTAAGSLLYFTSDNGSRLWKSDGTGPGTVEVRSVGPENSAFPVQFTELAAMGNSLYFRGTGPSPSAGGELWRTDGTASGTVLIKDIQPGPGDSDPVRLTTVGNVLYFGAATNAQGRELWKSDGTEAGTQLVKDANPGASHGLGAAPEFTAAGGLLYFPGTTQGAGEELWRTDGTDAGTQMVRDIQSGTASSSPRTIMALGANVVFSAATASSGLELWRSNGTEAGTFMLRDIRPGTESGLSVGGFSDDNRPSLMGGSIYFVGRSFTNGEELWRSDGTTAGTVMVRNIVAEDPDTGNPRGSDPRSLFTWGNLICFWVTGQDGFQTLWKSDGTSAGTVPLRDSASGSVPRYPGISPASPGFAVAGNQLIFSAYAPDTGAELWRTDGSSAGTSILKDSVVRSDGYPSSVDFLTTWRGDHYFQAYTLGSGAELWRTRADLAGVEMVRDIEPGAASSAPSRLTPAGNALYFTATTSAAGEELWKTGGSATDTFLIKDLPATSSGGPPTQLTVVGNRLYYVAATPDQGRELWKSDGSLESTLMVKDLRPGSLDGFPRSITAMGGAVYFGTDGDGVSSPLWKSVGTETGTTILRNFSSNGIPPAPSGLAVLNQTLLFSAALASSGRELWRSDGAAGSTSLVKDIAPGIVGSMSPASRITVMGNKAYFWARQEVIGDRLWMTDGTNAGTQPVWTPTSAFFDPDLTPLTACGAVLYFIASTATTGDELWRSDGTAAGTYLLRDIFPGPASSSVRLLGQKYGILFFAAMDDTHGVELWRTDGTPAGTFMVEDVIPGPESSLPISLSPSRDGIVYAMDNAGNSLPGLRSLTWPSLESPSSIEALPGGTIRLRFKGLQLRGHVLDSSPDLITWSSGPSAVPAADGTLEMEFPVSATRVYYRLRDIAQRPLP